MIQFRDYQEDAINAIFRYFEDNTGNPLVLMPTGTGKSVVLAGAAQRAIFTFPQTRIMIATHVEKLIKQNFEKLLTIWPTADAGIFSASVGRKDYKNSVIFAGVQSAWRNPAVFGFIDLLFVDEAHLVSAKEAGMYMTLIAGLRKINPRLKVVGLTATGWRTDNGPLVESEGLFTDVAIDMTTTAAWNWFIDQGYLSPLYGKRTRFELTAEGVSIRGGEYVESELQKAVDTDEKTQAAVAEMVQWGHDRDCWMVFGAGVVHCEHIAEALRGEGIEAVAIHSKSKNPEKLIEAYARGEYRAAVSMNKLTTGVDVPQIDLIGCMRHTMSSNLWVQMGGRGTRPVYARGFDLRTPEGRLAAIGAGPKARGCLVLDFARNVERLGPINAPVIPEVKAKRKKTGGGAAPFKVCGVCLEYCHTSARMCHVCGAVFPVNVRMEATASNMDIMVREVASPQVTEFAVDRVTYQVHHKLNKPDSMRVSYFTRELRMFSEFLCFEHGGPATARATKWWMERFVRDHGEVCRVPVTTSEALALTGRLRIPKKIHVWTNKPKPEITGYVYE